MNAAVDIHRYFPVWRTPDFEPWRPTAIPWKDCDPQRRRTLRKLWRAGSLSYKLDPEQLKVYRELRQWMSRPTTGKGRRRKKFGLDMSRRFGKSSIAFLIAVEERIRNPYQRRIAYWCSTQEQAQKIIVRDVLPWLLEDCPPEMRPEWEKSRKRILWANDHRDPGQCRAIELLGFDDADATRGGALFFGVIDECAFIPDLGYVDLSVVSKMMIGVSDAVCLFQSTPPVSPGHYWSATLLPQLRAAGAVIKRTIFDCPRLSLEEILDEIEESGGIDNSLTKRELLAEHDPDETMAILPEAPDAFRSGRCVYDVSKPEPLWRNCYVTMDPGWGDATGILFAWIDFERVKVVVEDEWLEAQAPSSVVAEALKGKERALWANVQRYSGEEVLPNPHRRWTDIDKRLVADLDHDHGLRFRFTQKDNLAQQINRVRNWLLSGTLEVHPRCVKLREQMIGGVYKNENRRDFARITKFGHNDLLACLVYLCRNAEPLLRKNPTAPKRPAHGEQAPQLQPGRIEARREKQQAQHKERMNRLRRRLKRGKVA